MSMIRLASILLLFALLLLLCSSAAAKSFCESCQFRVHPDNETECSVYGALSDDTLIPWHRASEACLEALNISMAAVDKKNMWNMCPTANPGTEGVDVNRLITLLRDSDSEASLAVKAQFEYFFIPVNNGTSYDLPETILDQQSNHVPCGESSTLCWGVIKLYFGLHADVIEQACTELHERQIASLADEQGAAREMLCERLATPETIPIDCQELFQQVRNFAPDAAACSELSRDANGFQLPECVKETSASLSWEKPTIVAVVTVLGMLIA